MLREHWSRRKAHPELARLPSARNLRAMLSLADENLRTELSHPEESELVRFMRGELKGPELSRIVRHLLTGCPACSRVTRRLWGLGDNAWNQE